MSAVGSLGDRRLQSACAHFQAFQNWLRHPHFVVSPDFFRADALLQRGEGNSLIPEQVRGDGLVKRRPLLYNASITIFSSV